MNGSVLVICPRGGAGENFARLMALELGKYNSENRVGFAYPYLPEDKEGNPALVQEVATVVRDGLVEGVDEFLFTDTSLVPVLAQVPELLPEEAIPIIYDPIEEARAYFHDPQERPLWLDRESIQVSGFKKVSIDDELIEEVMWRTRGVTGGNTEKVPAEFKASLVDEEFLRLRATKLLLTLAELPTKYGILLGNIDLATALTRYIDEEYREYIEKCHFVQLAKILAMRII